MINTPLPDICPEPAHVVPRLDPQRRRDHQPDTTQSGLFGKCTDCMLISLVGAMFLLSIALTVFLFIGTTSLFDTIVLGYYLFVGLVLTGNTVYLAVGF